MMGAPAAAAAGAASINILFACFRGVEQGERYEATC
jgi:hypothetical protein